MGHLGEVHRVEEDMAGVEGGREGGREGGVEGEREGGRLEKERGVRGKGSSDRLIDCWFTLEKDIG